MQRVIFFTLLFIVFYIKNGFSQDVIRKALLIGNSKYVYYNQLSNSLRDVDSMAVVLKSLGFLVTVKKDAEYRTMAAAVSTFVQTLQQDDIALLYYSGHGIGYNGNNYLLPIEEDFNCMNQLEELIPISLNKIIKNIESKGVKNSFVFLDACRNLPKFKICDNSKSTSGNSQGFIIPSNNPKGNLIFFATSEGSVANDNTYDNTNSLFTSELLKFIRIPDLSIRDIVDKVTNGVELRSDYKQTPQKMEDLRGDFFFLKTSDEEKARVADEIRKKQEDEIRVRLKLELENKKQEEIKLENIRLEEKRREEVKELKILEDKEKNKKDLKVKEINDKEIISQNIKQKAENEKLVNEKLEKQKLETKPNVDNTLLSSKFIDFKNEVQLGEYEYSRKEYAKALLRLRTAKTIEKLCKECILPDNTLDNSILNIENNIKIIKYKRWKTTNKLFMGVSLISLGAYSKYYNDFQKANKNLTNKQRIVDPDGDKSVFISNISYNKPYTEYLVAYKELSSLKQKSNLYNGVLISGAFTGSVYILKKIIGKRKPDNIRIIPFKSGLSLHFQL